MTVTYARLVREGSDWQFKCSICSTRVCTVRGDIAGNLGLSRDSQAFGDGATPIWRVEMAVGPTVRVTEAEQDGVVCYGQRRGAWLHPGRPLVRGDKASQWKAAKGRQGSAGATAFENAGVDYGSPAAIPTLTYGGEHSKLRFDTWCPGLGHHRVRVETTGKELAG